MIELKSDRGKDKYVHEGFAYVFDKMNAAGTVKFWRCDRKSEGCKGRIHTNAETNELVKIIKGHTHDSRAGDINGQNARHEIKRRAIETQETPGQILNQVLPNVGRAAAGVMPNKHALKQTIRYHRRAVGAPPAIPSELDELEVPDNYAYFNDGEAFLLGDSILGEHGNRWRAGRHPTCLIFGEESYTNWSGTMKRVFVDGMFTLAPPLFGQLFAFLAERNTGRGTFVFPILYALLPNKRERTYSVMFQMVRQIWPDFDPDSISVDFEMAILNAAAKEFPEAEINGCLFHLMYNFRKHLASSGILARYNTDSDFALNCRMIPALAFVPVQDVPDAFEALKDYLSDDEYAPLLEWFGPTYVRKPTRNGSYRAPLFPIAIWSCYERTLDGQGRTNNNAEASHRRLQIQFQVAHPSIWKFIDELKKIQGGQDFDMEQCIAGFPPQKKRHAYVEHDERILALVSAYDDIANYPDYLRAIAHNIRME